MPNQSETPRQAEPATPRARPGDVLRLLSGAWRALAGMVLMAVLLFGVMRALFPLDATAMPKLLLDLCLAVAMLLSIFLPPVVFLRAAAAHAMDRPEPFVRSCVEAVRRIPALIMVMAIAAGYWIGLIALIMVPVIFFKASLLTVPELRPPVEQMRAINWIIYGFAAYFVAFPLVVRAALLAPVMVLGEGMGGLDAWRFSWNHTTRRMAARALPYFLPAVAWHLFANTWNEPFYTAFLRVLAFLPGPGIFLVMHATMILAGAAAIVLWRGLPRDPGTAGRIDAPAPAEYAAPGAAATPRTS